MTKRDPNFVTTIEVSSTDVFHAIERARLRLLLMSSVTPMETVEFARATLDELGKIIDAKNAYDARVAAAEAKRAPEPEETHSPKPGRLN